MTIDLTEAVVAVTSGLVTGLGSTYVVTQKLRLTVQQQQRILRDIGTYLAKLPCTTTAPILGLSEDQDQ